MQVNDDDAVVHLGVGKNMVASIKFWLKAIGLLKDTGLEPIADHLFDDENGRDPYLEDIGTLWLLHFLVPLLFSRREIDQTLIYKLR